MAASPWWLCPPPVGFGLELCLDRFCDRSFVSPCLGELPDFYLIEICLDPYVHSLVGGPRGIVVDPYLGNSGPKAAGDHEIIDHPILISYSSYAGRVGVARR